MFELLPVAKLHIDGERGAVTVDQKTDRASGGHIQQPMFQLLGILNRLPVKLKNHVMDLKARLTRGRVMVHKHYLGSVGIFQMERSDPVGIDLA